MYNVPSKEELAKIPKLYSTENIPLKDKIIHMHFFLCDSDWYIAEYDGKDTFFGFACINGWKDLAEWGYISFSELKDLKVNVPINIHDIKSRTDSGTESAFIPIEVDRNLYFKPPKSSKIHLIRECNAWS